MSRHSDDLIDHADHENQRHYPWQEDRLRIACTNRECIDGLVSSGLKLIACPACLGRGYTIETDAQYAERTRDARSERLNWETR
jgi:hypothetical protein